MQPLHDHSLIHLGNLKLLRSTGWHIATYLLKFPLLRNLNKLHKLRKLLNFRGWDSDYFDWR